MNLGLKNRNVIVAAASEGIARAAAEKFAAEGANVAICSRDAGKLNAAATELRERYSARVLAEPLDVTDEKAVDLFVKHVAEEFGGVDVCVANAGGPPAKMFFATTTEEWHRAIELNFMSVVHFARAVLPWDAEEALGQAGDDYFRYGAPTDLRFDLLQCGAGRSSWFGEKSGQRVR